MNTREPERLFYTELAKQKARISRQLSGADLPRFLQLVASGGIATTANVELSFAIDDEDRVQVAGYAEVAAPLVCHRCSETLVRNIRVSVSVCLIADDQLATVLGAQRDVLVTDGTSVTVAGIVEDELILGLPENLCDSDPCELTPGFSYPVQIDHEGDENIEQDAEANPFSVLARMKTQNRDS